MPETQGDSNRSAKRYVDLHQSGSVIKNVRQTRKWKSKLNESSGDELESNLPIINNTTNNSVLKVSKEMQLEASY